MSNKFILIHIIAMALTTYLVRMLPLALLRKKIKSKFIQSFLCYVPYAVLSAMTFPAVFYSTSYISSAVVGLVVGLILSYKGKGLLTVSIFASLFVFIAEFFLR